MTTIDDLELNLTRRQQAAQRRKAAAQDGIRVITGQARRQSREWLTSAETGRADHYAREVELAADELAVIDAELAECRRAAAEAGEQYRRQSETHDTGLRRPYEGSRRTASLHITRGERTYRPDTDPRGTGFLRDVGAEFLYGPSCPGAQRLGRHMAEEEAERASWGGLQERASGTGNFAGLVVPQYLTDMFAPVARAMRPFADCCNHHDLPDEGMTVNIPLLTTGNTVVLQSAENNAPAGSSPNDTLLTENVQTFSGNATISRQAIDRGTGIDQVVMQDMFNALASQVDSTLITQATTGLQALATTVTYTSAAPTQAEYWPYIFRAGSTVARSVLQVARTSHVVMSIPRWNWLCSGLSSTWPFAAGAVQGAAPDAHQGAVIVTGEYGPAVSGKLSNGWLVSVDANVPVNLGAGTNQDQAYVVAGQECHLWEAPGSPVLIRAEQPAAASLGVLFVVYEYAAYSFRRLTGVAAKIDGSGMVTPAGF